MQFASFDLADPIFSAFGFRFSLQLTTLENLYGVDPERVRIHEAGDSFLLRCDRLSWAGQQERAEGELEIELGREPGGSVRARLRARAASPIRTLKLVLRDLEPPLAVFRPGGGEAAVGEYGELLAYPELLPAPLACIRCGDERLGLRAEDGEVRPKRFAAWLERIGPLAGRGSVELIHEEAASRFAVQTETPDWVLERGASAQALERAHLAFAERERGLVPWEARNDVPAWARDLRLVATLHGMHFSGRVFLGYAEMLEILRFLAERLPGRHILAYLPGWEGRYYWQYGDYRPEARLGGCEGFATLCREARQLGVHVMPMFGANCANLWLPGVGDLPSEAVLASATGNRFHGNQPDWDLARAHDTGWQAWFNPGHPAWRDKLAGSIEALAGEYEFEGVFLDTIHAWTNDPHHPVTDGIRALVERLRQSIPGVLLAAEADYDALLPLFPLFQRPWWTSPAPWTARYVRRFAHLCEGEPRGLTGVHEAGVYRSDAWRPGPGTLATVAFQDGTLEACREELERLLDELAHRPG
jgi:hypothetical protein